MPNKPNFANLFDVFQANVNSAMLEYASNDLGLSVGSLKKFGVGFRPDKHAWVMPERDQRGEIIGLVYRYFDGKKSMEKGSKRGLIFIPNSTAGEQKYVPGKHNWQRVSKSTPCHICGKSDGCLVPAGNPPSPQAVVCVHISEGSEKPLGLGYLHILKPGGNISKGLRGILQSSKFPVVVVEGYTDTVAATDLGFVAVGRPSAEGGMDLLPQLLKNRNVIIVGDNDAGAGKSGMESAFQTLKPVCKSVVKVLPPEMVKDFRIWKNEFNLTQEEFLKWAKEHGDSADDSDLLPSDIGFDIAKCYLTREKLQNGQYTLRNYKGQWMQHMDGCYCNHNIEILRGEIYRFLENKTYPKLDINGGINIMPFKSSRYKISDIVDALNAFCPVSKDPPVWLDNEEHPDPKDLIVFKNGVLNVREYIENGNATLYPVNPALFTLNRIPYDFNPELESKLFYNFIDEIFSGDEDKIKLLGQWFGYNLVPDMSYEKLMLFTGRPRSGKSTLLETMVAMLGQQQCCSTSFQSLCGAFGYEPLIGKLAAIIGDAKTPRAIQQSSALEKILQITGGDPVTINRKQIRQLASIHLTCRFSIAMNDLPVFTDHARALEPRMNIISFDNSYVNREDYTLKGRLKKEAERGKLINFALRGLKDLYGLRHFTTPASSKEILESFRELTSPMTAFMADCCETLPDDSDEFTTKDCLYETWQKWCVEQGRKPGLKQQFGRWLLSSAPQLKIGRKVIKNRRLYIYYGIKLQDWVYSEYLGRP